jgi:hypothetical protein
MRELEGVRRVSLTNDQSPNRKTDLDPLLWTIAAAITGAIVFVVYTL